MSKQGETTMLIECLYRERDSLFRKIEIMEKELGQIKTQKEKEVNDQKSKNSDLRQKLD